MIFTLQNSAESKKSKSLLLTLYEKLGTPIRSSLQYCLNIIHFPTPESMVIFSFLPPYLLITAGFTLETFKRFIFLFTRLRQLLNTAVSKAIP